MNRVSWNNTVKALCFSFYAQTKFVSTIGGDAIVGARNVASNGWFVHYFNLDFTLRLELSFGKIQLEALVFVVVSDFLNSNHGSDHGSILNRNCLFFSFANEKLFEVYEGLVSSNKGELGHGTHSKHSGAFFITLVQGDCHCCKHHLCFSALKSECEFFFLTRSDDT